MHRARRVAFVAWFVVSAGGCAAVSGLDNIQEQSCTSQCDASSTADVVVDVPTVDQTAEQAPETSTMDQAVVDSPPETTTTHDSSAPETAAEAGVEGGVDAGVDAPPDVSIDDAPFDTGCGNLNTTTNCSACGTACATVSASQSDPQCCTNGVCPGSTNGAGATCEYTCGAGHLDCNASVAPDTDGCECTAPGATASQCCGTACPVQHDYDKDIVGATFYDCVATGTYNITVATDACAAYTGSSTQCDAMGTYYCDYPDGGLAGDMVCSDGTGAQACACWGYDGALQGHMFIGPGKASANPNNCECPEPTDPSWN